MPQGDLRKARDAKDLCALEKDLAYQLWLDLATALAHCHKLGIVHGDVKLQNILQGATLDPPKSCQDTGLDPRVISFKLCDFGLATDEGRVQGVCGTPGYLPPEVLIEDPRRPGWRTTPSSDIYALGVVILWAFRLISAPKVRLLLSKLRDPGPDRQQFTEWAGKIDVIRRELPPSLSLLARMLDRSCSTRITARQLLQQLPAARVGIVKAHAASLLVGER